MLPSQIAPGQPATLLGWPRLRREGRCYCATVRVLDVRRHTARVEVRRMDGRVFQRFVKLGRLLPGARWR